MKDKGTAYILCLAGFIGLGGLHRFYLGDWKVGILYFLTLGLLGLGTIWDLIHMQELMDRLQGELAIEAMAAQNAQGL